MDSDKPLNILVIDDDFLMRWVFRDCLTKKGHNLDFAKDSRAAARKIETGSYDICFIDLQLGKEDEKRTGLTLIPKAVEKGFYSVVVSGHDGEQMVDKAYSLGCDDFYAKGNRDTANAIEQVLARFRHRRQGRSSLDVFENRFVTVDPAMRQVVGELLKFGPTDVTVLLLGPTGAGKTNLARVIHDFSGRPGRFISMNCAAYSEDLIEAELYGVKSGAFTGAEEDRAGKLLAADQGTLFLDEIGSMSLKMQAKLLKAIEEREFYPVGASEPERSEFRLISATLEDPQRLIRRGKMRPDFFARIHGFSATLTPLSVRRADILPLFHFFNREGRRLALTSEAKTELLNHPWPGNTRELKRVVDILMAGQAGRIDGETVKRILGRNSTAKAEKSWDDLYEFALSDGLDAAVQRFKNWAISRTLNECGGRRSKTLERLKITRRKFYSFIGKSESPQPTAVDEPAA